MLLSSTVCRPHQQDPPQSHRGGNEDQHEGRRGRRRPSVRTCVHTAVACVCRYPYTISYTVAWQPGYQHIVRNQREYQPNIAGRSLMLFSSSSSSSSSCCCSSSSIQLQHAAACAAHCGGDQGRRQARGVEQCHYSPRTEEAEDVDFLQYCEIMQVRCFDVSSLHFMHVCNVWAYIRQIESS
jgi:hypothetical protein